MGIKLVTFSNGSVLSGAMRFYNRMLSEKVFLLRLKYKNNTWIQRSCRRLIVHSGLRMLNLGLKEMMMGGRSRIGFLIL